MRTRSGKFLAFSVNRPTRKRMTSRAAQGGSKRACMDFNQQETEEADRMRDSMEDPLMNDVILDNVFKRCTPAMLNNCRAVNKKWYQAALRVWRRADPAIKLECKRKRRGGDREIANTRTYVSEFVQDFHSGVGGGDDSDDDDGQLNDDINGMRQHKKFELNVDKTVNRPRTRMAEFWNGAGQWITSLKITYKCYDRDGPSDARFLKHIFLCDYTPNLEQLDIHMTIFTEADLTLDVGEKDEKDVNDVQQQQGSPPAHSSEGKSTRLKSLKISGALCPFLLLDWKAYLGTCPKLANLDLSNCFLHHELKRILTAINEIRAGDKTKLNLKSLSWCDVGNARPRLFSSAVPTLMKESQLDSLESLSVYFNGVIAPPPMIFEMCTMHSNSLKRLSFYRNVPLETSPFLGVSMTSLDSLFVEGKAFENLSFLRELPNLRSLKLMLGRSNPEPRTSFHKGGHTIISATSSKAMGRVRVTLRSLSSFSCDYVNDFDARDLSRLREWMPNLLALELQLNNESFPHVCELWPKLTHVCVFGGKIGDRGIAGLKISREGRVNRFTMDEPNITNLRDLRSFKVLGSNYGAVGDRKLTALSVVHGLSRLARLEQIHFSRKVTQPETVAIWRSIMELMPTIFFVV